MCMWVEFNLDSLNEMKCQATPRLSEDKVKQCVDPKLKGEYPPKAVAKVFLFCTCQHTVYVQLVHIQSHTLFPILNHVFFWFIQLAAVAALCVQYEAEFRPNMSIVVKALQPLLKTPAPAAVPAPET